MTFPLVRMWMNSIAAGPLRTEIMIDQIEAINTEQQKTNAIVDTVIIEKHA